MPSKTFAEGFESLLVTLKDGSIAGGIVKKETADALVLVSPEGVAQTVKKKDIKAREQGASGMPDGLAEILTRRELRDLVEFLATLR